MFTNNVNAVQHAVGNQTGAPPPVPGRHNAVRIKPAEMSNLLNTLKKCVANDNVVDRITAIVGPQSNEIQARSFATQTKNTNDLHISSGPASALGQDDQHIEELLRLIQEVQLALVPLSNYLETRAASREMHRMTERLANEANRIKQLIKEGILPAKLNP